MPKIARSQEKKASKHPKLGRSQKKASRKPKIAKNGEKTFKHFYDIPAEIRMMVIDEMEPIDRCRFSLSSFLSSMEAKRSKNYIHSMEFLVFTGDEKARISVTYDDDLCSGYSLSFLEESGKKYIKYVSQCEELWKTELPGNTDLLQYAAGCFKNMLQEYQHIIKKLIVRNFAENNMNNFDFGLWNLRSLEELDIDTCSSILPAISKLRKPLETLAVYDKEIMRELENYEVSNISKRIDLRQLKLNYDQFAQLSATMLCIHIGELTEEDICKIIKSWKSQPTEEKTIRYKWNLEGSTFDFSKLLRILGPEKSYELNANFGILKIKHRFENGRKALLYQEDNFLRLEAK